MTVPRRHALPASALALASLVWPAFASAQVEAGPHPRLPPPREIPGITAPDPYPEACVDCHVLDPDQGLDVRFSTLLSRWANEVEPELLARATASSRAGVTLAARHPEVGEEVLMRVPEACIGCHRRRRDEAPDLVRLIHLIHLQGGADNVFLTVFQGECTHCHKLDAALGVWTVPSGAERVAAVR